ncbi:mucin-1-like [Paramormyrops kingsleyae]|uniref:mucin-1-like n=1 Tax=Paramormyrops kingsleyae TaxID=1676925 RepID=UPI003B97C998
MTRQPLVSLGIILCLTSTLTEGLPERRLHPSSSRIPIQTQDNGGSSSFVLSMRITNRIYSQSLEDPASSYCENLWAEVAILLQQIFGCSGCATVNTYGGIADMAFSKGSVIANSTLVFNTKMINGDIVKYTFCNALLTGAELHTNLNVDPTYTLNLPAPEMIPVE